MSEWKAKRFWKEATVEPDADGFTIRLDGRPVKTPAKAALVVPTVSLAQEIAAEWDAQAEKINPETMPFTRSANAAIDKVAHQHEEVAEMISAYGDADLLCYRAVTPVELITRQEAAWDPLLAWAKQAHCITLTPVNGVMHQPQSPEALQIMEKLASEMSGFELTAFHDLVSLSGSFVIGLAAAASAWPVADLWTLSRVDEHWQEEQWGADDEAAAEIAVKQQAFFHAARFYTLCKTATS